MARNNDQSIMIMEDEESTVCAWCNQHAGIPQGDGSHGICDQHAEITYIRYHVSKVSSAVKENAVYQKRHSLFQW